MAALSDLDRAVSALAHTQYGVLTYQQMRELGLGRQAIAHRVKRQRLIELYPCVYALVHAALRIEGRWLAAVYAGGERAVLSHGDAAALWELAPVSGSRIDVMTPTRSGRVPQRPVRLHRVGTLHVGEMTTHREIPVTTVARTLLDLAALRPSRALEDLIAQAVRLDRFDLRDVHRALAAHSRQPGRGKLIALLDRLAGASTADIRSRAELAMLQLCDEHGLPTPATNAVIAGFTVDFVWPHAKLIVETDGFTYHSMPTVFESDRDRDQLLMLAGYRVMRFTYNQLTHQRARSARRLRALLAESGSL
jgi:hypothetical protein